MHISMRRRPRGRPLTTWIKTVRENLLDLEITNGHWDSRVAWRIRIIVANLNNRNEL